MAVLKVGSVVRATAGRDKDQFFCVVEITQEGVKLADGKTRPLEKPKQKNPKHIQATTAEVDVTVATNKQLRTALRPFNESLRSGKQQEGGNRFCQKQM